MQLQPATLENAVVRLEPLSEAHREPLRAACAADAEIWTALYPYSLAGEHFAPRFREILADAARGPTLPFAVVVGGEVVGMTSFLAIDPINASVEIGATYYRPDVRGGAVNPAAKRLLLAHAFAAGARRVQLKVDALNARSRAAVLKLGAVQEGILRQDRVTWTGRVRDTVHFSILAGEWPAVRDRLDARLAAQA
ncbi:GNAT family protein [Phenylobacterium sp. LjRoot219]|uniref:GNAT family N-acetyltransferase n=1 Tax=Phenylobacterium sp. LjRoot219 TaxID=3342283 RepID=UPI003ECD75FB